MGRSWVIECGREGERPLVLIHGNMTSSVHWDVVLERIDGRFRVYAVDLRGFGLSTYRRPVESLRDFAADVKEWIDALGLERYSVMGWSMGGGVAMHLAADRPEQVEKLVLLASVSHPGLPLLWDRRKGAAHGPAAVDQGGDRRRSGQNAPDPAGSEAAGQAVSPQPVGNAHLHPSPSRSGSV